MKITRDDMHYDLDDSLMDDSESVIPLFGDQDSVFILSASEVLEALKGLIKKPKTRKEKKQLGDFVRLVAFRAAETADRVHRQTVLTVLHNAKKEFEEHVLSDYMKEFAGISGSDEVETSHAR